MTQTVDYDGSSYELTPVRVPLFVVSCTYCDLYLLECAEIDPDCLCYAPTGDHRVFVFKEIPIVLESQ